MAWLNIFTDNFDSATLGATPPNWAGSQWLVTATGLNGSAQKVGPPSSTGTFYRTFTAWSRVRLSFRVKTGASTVGRNLRVMGTRPGVVPSSNETAFLLLFETGGQIQIFHSNESTGAATSVNAQTWVANTEYAVSIDVDCLTQRFTVTVGTVVYDNSGRGYPFYKGADSTIGVVLFDSGNNSAGLDEIAVDKYSPEAVEIVTPYANQVIQRNARSEADIVVTGRYPDGAETIEARWKGGDWVTIATAPSEGFFTGVLESQQAGQGALEIRADGGTATKQNYVGIGGIKIIIGQSNNSGRGTNNQRWRHPWLRPALFGNDYVWKELGDPFDSGTGQLDSVSLDAAAAGSWVPHFATRYMEAFEIPAAFVPCAMGGTSITAWLPTANRLDRATLYGSMLYRIRQVGGCESIMMHLGETDATNGMSQATFRAHLATLAAAIYADTGVKLMVNKLQNSSAVADALEDAINAAIQDAWDNDDNVLAGADCSESSEDGELASEDNPGGYHFTSDGMLAEVGRRNFEADRAILSVTSFIKETGAGLTDANSYASVADGDTYHNGHLYASDWTGASVSTKEAALIMATRLIDGTFDFRGFRSSNSQALQWPRQMCVDPDRADVRLSALQNNVGCYFDSDAVPQGVVDATCELARELIKSDSTDAPDGEGLASLNIPGAVSLTFQKSDTQPFVSRLARTMLEKFGSYRAATGGIVKLTRV